MKIEYKFTILAFLICSPFLILSKIPVDDCAVRYAPMADAFANFDWKYAFHPRIPPLFTTLSGICATLLFIDGFTACKIISILFYAIGIIPLFKTMLIVYNKKTAIISCFLYLLCSRLIRISGQGIRDSAKAALILLIVYGFVLLMQNRDKIKGYICFIFGISGLMLLRGDSFLFTLTLFPILFFIDLYKNKQFRLPVKAITSSILILFLISPWLYYQYKMIGYPVTESRIGMQLDKYKNRSAIIKFLHNKQAIINVKNENISKIIPSSLVPKQKNKPIVNPPSMGEFISNILVGLFPYYLIFAIPIIFLRIKNGKWKKEETLLVSILITNIFLLSVQVYIMYDYFYISKRYVITVTPLYFGFTALGMSLFHNKICNLNYKFSKPIIRSIMILCSIGLYLNGISYVYPISTKKTTRKNAILKVSNWLKTNHTKDIKMFPSHSFHNYNYIYPKKVGIFTSTAAIAYLADLNAYNIEKYSKKFCEMKNISYYIEEKRKINKKIKFSKVYETGNSKYDYAIYQLSK